MGFFKAIGRAFGKVAEKVGDFTGIEPLSKWGRNIQEKCAEEVSSERSYEKREASISSTDRLNDILVSFSEGYLEEATRMEKDCIRYVEAYYDKLIRMLENDSNDAVINHANLRALKMGKKRIRTTITGGIKEPLAKRLSLDDSECLRILKMDAGSEKKAAMLRFTNKVIGEALDNLSNEVRESLDDSTDDIVEYLNNIAEEQEKAMQALKQQLDKMTKTDKENESNMEKQCVVPMYIVDVSNNVSAILK